MKLGATQSPGEGGLRQGVLREELTWQIGGTAGRPACLRRVSRGMGGSWSQSSGWKLDGPNQRRDVVDVTIKRVLWWSLEGQ